MAQQNKEIQFNISPEVAAGLYSNFSIIAHGPNEFFIDFATLAPNMPQAKVQARIILTPENAKNLLAALADNVRKYEETFGEITRTLPRKQQSGGGTPNPFITGGNA